MPSAQDPNHQAIDTHASVEEEEQEEIFVGVQADAIVQPSAMMVEFLHAEVAELAMLRARWFGHITGVTPAFLIKEHLIVRVALNSAFQVGFGHLFA